MAKKGVPALPGLTDIAQSGFILRDAAKTPLLRV
jgi:hypothetical protein